MNFGLAATGGHWGVRGEGNAEKLKGEGCPNRARGGIWLAFDMQKSVASVDCRPAVPRKNCCWQRFFPVGHRRPQGAGEIENQDWVVAGGDFGRLPEGIGALVAGLRRAGEAVPVRPPDRSWLAAGLHQATLMSGILVPFGPMAWNATASFLLARPR